MKCTIYRKQEHLVQPAYVNKAFFSVNYFMVIYLGTKCVKELHTRLTTSMELGSLERPKFAQLVKKLRAFNGTPKFTRTHQLSSSCIECTQKIIKSTRFVKRYNICLVSFLLSSIFSRTQAA